MTQAALTDTENVRPSKPATMEDVARLAGVHSRTVADALKGTGRVAPATRERVLRIAQELRYVPNAAGRALRTGRTGTVAIFSGPLNDLFNANMVHSLEFHLTANGYDIMLLHTRREVEDLVQAARVSLVDGFIVIGINHLAEEFLRLAGDTIQPHVFIGTTNPNFADHITLELRPAVEEALQLMLDAGRQRIAYVINNRDEASHREVRMGTYLNVMKEANRIPEVIGVNTKTSPEDRIQAIKTYIEHNGCPDALLCQNDETAIYTFRALTGLGHRIPDDVLLVGCDGLPFMEFFEPPLSTIALPSEDICALAAQFLQQRMINPGLPVQQATLQGHLMVRKSLETSHLSVKGPN
ncbi:ribose operon repressor [Abditibacteriota bacterium]|nr:ribose operon repressor [Abditibacteriota bacterium]